MINPLCPNCVGPAEFLASAQVEPYPTIRAFFSCQKCGAYSEVYGGRYTNG